MVALFLKYRIPLLENTPSVVQALQTGEINNAKPGDCVLNARSTKYPKPPPYKFPLARFYPFKGEY